ncbi:MAG: DUF2625 domain-containing protein [Sandaracinaceae bacterium]|nr:DUF2625 domain-containing protein [Sandaracinaceae bacterium]
MHEWLALAGERARVLTVDAARGRRVAAALGVSDRALLCAVATELGAVVVDDGWVRVLGGGAEGHEADLASVNGLGDRVVLGLSPGLLIVGFDVLGGVFAMDGGARWLGARRGVLLRAGLKTS